MMKSKNKKKDPGNKKRKKTFALNTINSSVEEVYPGAGSTVKTEPDLNNFNFLEKLGDFGHFKIDLEKKLFYGSTNCFNLLGVKAKSGKITLSGFKDLIKRKKDLKAFEKSILSLQEENNVFKLEIRFNKSRNNKDFIDLRVTGCLRIEQDKSFIIGIILDITSDKKIEKELFKSKAEIEKADRQKSLFLKNLSYELRTPMNSILGFSKLLDMPSLSREKVDEYTSIIHSKGNQLLSMIDDVIELSRFELGYIKLIKTEFKISEHLKELYKEFDKLRIESGKENIALILNIPENLLDKKIYSDTGRFYRLISILLSNALKFTDKGKIELGITQSNKFYKIYVSDTGVGLSEEDQRKVFNRFEYFEETDSNRLNETGLSLTIAKHIVELLGGKIKVKSELKKGSRFMIKIPVETPVKSENNMNNEIEDISRMNWKDKVVLIAEDEEVNYRFLEAILEKTQAKVLRAKNGKEAVELVENIKKIHIILMDIKMPVMNGYDAINEIKNMRPELPIIAQTAFSVHEEILKCKNAGCNDYVTKPIDISLLIKKMTRLLS